MKYLTFLVGCLIFLCAPSSRSIAQERTASKAAEINSSLAEPIRITPLSLQTGESRAARSRAENVNWVNQPVLQVENISGKSIKYLSIEISFPGAESLSAQSPLTLAYGQSPGQKALSTLATVLQPDTKINLSVGQNASDAVKSRLLASHLRPPSGSRATARIGSVIFTDGTAWFDGLLHVADPDNPLRWTVAGKTLSRMDFNYMPLFQMMKASYRAEPVASTALAPCWDRIGTEWVSCCDGPFGNYSAILVQVWGGLWEPHTVSTTCPDGETTCEWIKQVGCSSDPQG